MFSAKVAAIEFDGDLVRVATLATGGRLPVLLEAQQHLAEYDHESGEGRTEALTAALDKALSGLKHTPAAYVLCLSSAYGVARNLTIPFRGARRVAAAVPFELEPYLAFPLEEMLVDFNVIAEINGETEVLALGMRRAQIEEYRAMLRAAGIEPEAVTLDGVAMTGLWQAAQKNLKGLNAVLHAREQGSCIAITWNNRLAHLRHLPIGAAQLLDQPAQAAREIQITLRAFLAKWRGEGEITALHLTGIEPDALQRQHLEQALRMGLIVDHPLEKVKGAGLLALVPGGGARANAFEAAIGAGLSAGGGGYAIDFLKAERSVEGALRSLVTHTLFSSCLALLVLLGWAFYYYQGTSKNNALLRQIRAEVDAISAEIDTIEQGGLGDVDVQAFTDPTLLDILQDLGARMPGDKVTLVHLRMAQPGAKSGWIVLEGTATNSAAFNEVYASLKSSRFFTVDANPDIRVEGATTSFRVRIFRRDDLGMEEAEPAAGGDTMTTARN
jgi:Tfp pilus assembly protein PilN